MSQLSNITLQSNPNYRIQTISSQLFTLKSLSQFITLKTRRSHILRQITLLSPLNSPKYSPSPKVHSEIFNNAHVAIKMCTMHVRDIPDTKSQFLVTNGVRKLTQKYSTFMKTKLAISIQINLKKIIKVSVSVEACQRNIKFSGSVATSKVESHLADARVYMLMHPKEFYIDLDPYGSPSIFLDSAVQSVVDGGILMCTTTDMAVLYKGNGKYCHEMALRILLGYIESHANRYKRYIIPVLSVQMDFYVRVFVRIFTSASAMKNTPLKLSYVYQCTGCDYFHLQPLGRTISKPALLKSAVTVGKKFNMEGPIWAALIHDQESMKDKYPAYGHISAVLTTISKELPDVSFFVSLHNLCATLKCTSPSAVIFRSAVINAGYRVSGSHVNPLGLKSDAPMHVIWDTMRCWVKNHLVKAQAPDQSRTIILAKESVLQANFSRAVASFSKAQAKKVARRQITSKHISLLGLKVVNNGHLNQDNGEEFESKHQKTEDAVDLTSSL
ncbi:hypothetical protein K2173_025978 [Erythroxylum novogranatense]|uniref:tRNA (guanine(26)-N(2))-dimethyltransferase n=1 Tax=Erythroxylum novogranatense TaxID=1862640 RepID=A0AAV8SHR7_9ROSI|nr:hypothetical protein K2173_025978 [Erythroxylum novogranatense]